MKIAILLPRGMSFSENGATSIDLVAYDLLIHSNHLKETIVLGTSNGEPFAGIDFRRLKATSQRRRDQEALTILEGEEVDIVIVHQYPPAAFFLSRKLANTRIVLHRHTLLKKKKPGLLRYLRRKAFSKIDQIIFVSDFLRQSFLDDYSGLEGKCSVIPNGIDPDFWKPASYKEKKVTFVGRARADKGINELIDAFLSLDVNDWTLQIILAVQTEAEQQFASSLKTRTQGISSIKFEENFSSTHVKGALATASIAALPSIVREGFHRAAIEAMACGCATIATRSGGTPEATSGHALLLETATSETITEALKLLVCDPQTLSDWAQRGRCHAVERQNIQAISTSYDELIASLHRKIIRDRNHDSEAQ